MIAQHHTVIAHGRALAECLAQYRAVSDSRQRVTVIFDEVHGRWNLTRPQRSEPLLTDNENGKS
jgi:hypothetical protein